MEFWQVYAAREILGELKNLSSNEVTLQEDPRILKQKHEQDIQRSVVQSVLDQMAADNQLIRDKELAEQKTKLAAKLHKQILKQELELQEHMQKRLPNAQINYDLETGSMNLNEYLNPEAE